MAFHWLRNLFPGRVTQQRSRRRQSRPASVALETLEARTLLTGFYDLQVLASTYGGNFENFGDLVSLNTTYLENGATQGGTVSFVGFTDLNTNGALESGLWTVNSAGQLVNINPEYSDTDGRDFGRAVSMNDAGLLAARDLYSAGGVQYFVRTWEPDDPDAHTNIASANNSLQSDFGKYAALQTFTDISERGDVVLVTLKPTNVNRNGDAPQEDQPLRTLVWRSAEGQIVEIDLATKPGESVPRPQLTGGGRILYRASDTELRLLNPLNNQSINVAAGFKSIGFAPGVSNDGNLITFMGDKGDGLGVYLAYNSGGTYQTVRIAGAGKDGWTEFDLTDAVRVNNTLDTERGVTVAFEAVHGTLGRGVYSTRVSFIDSEGPVEWDRDYAQPYVHGTTPVALIGGTVNGRTITDVEFWNGLNDHNRGEMAFWVQTGSGQQIVRATPWQVAMIDFEPGLCSLPVTSPAAADLLRQFGVSNNVGWDDDFSRTMVEAGLGILATSDAEALIVDTVQDYFQDAGARVKVYGYQHDPLPAYVPWTGTMGNHQVTRGVYSTVFVGGKDAATSRDNGEYGMASPVYAGMGGLDYFNQIADDYAVVFANRIFAEGGAFTDPTTAPYEKLIQAIASITAHELGHNFGLYHLSDTTDATLNEIMRTTTSRDTDLTTTARFSAAWYDRQAYVLGEEVFTPGSESSAGRLTFGTGQINAASPAPVAPDYLALSASDDMLRANMPFTPTGQGPTSGRLLIGIRHTEFGESIPDFIDLGTGNIADLLAAAKLRHYASSEIILLGSTDGTQLDIVGVPNGETIDLSTFSNELLSLIGDSRLRAPVTTDAGSSGFQLYHRPAAGAAVLMGQVDIELTAELSIRSTGETLDSGSVFGLGETTPQGGDLSRTLTIRNTGSGTLDLGTVSIVGAGFSVTQPTVTSLAPGAETTVTITLSDDTAGVGIPGTLTIPSNDPAGTFTLMVRGTVDSRPRVTGITRLDSGSGPLQIAVDFSAPLLAGPAGDVANFTVSRSNGTAIPLASAVYSVTGNGSRIVLTASVNSADVLAGEYRVRVDGAQVRTADNIPLETTRFNLIAHQNWEAYHDVVIGADGSGSAAILSGPTATGASPPDVIVQEDFNGDGLPDYAVPNRIGGGLLLYLGQLEGGYSITSIDIEPPSADFRANPVSTLATDWNVDGFVDLVVFDRASVDGHSSNRLLVYLNDGQANFTLAPDMPIMIDLTIGGPLLGVGDFTGDGLPDVAIAGPPVDGSGASYSAKGSVAIFSKDPFLGYSQIGLFSTEHSEWYPESADVADVNGDGRDDLIVNTNGYYVFSPQPVVYLGTDNGLQLAADLEYEGEGGRAFVADFTSDGVPDIVIVNDNYSNSAGISAGGQVNVLAGDGSGGFTALPELVLNTRGVNLIAVGDVNLDGLPDLILRGDPFEQDGYNPIYELSLWVLPGTGDGNFDLSRPMIPLGPAGVSSPTSFILSDVSGDGYPDLSFGNQHLGRIGVMLNDGSGQFIPTLSGPINSTATDYQSQFNYEHGVLVIDLNRDGLPDMVRAVYESTTMSGQGLDVFWGQTDGTFELVNTVDTPYVTSPNGQTFQSTSFIRGGDLNNDGWIDFIIGNESGYGGPIVVYLGIDGTNFELATDLITDAGASRGVWSADLVDVNQDGNLDVLATVTSGGSVATGWAVFFGNGTGRLSYNSNTYKELVNFSDQRPAIGDFNGDGIADLVVGVDFYDGVNYSAFQTYLGLGNGLFRLAHTETLPELDYYGHVFTHDINGDGILDIISPDESTDMLSFYLGNGDGTFTRDEELDLDVGMRVRQIEFLDLTGDGLDDIAITKKTPWIYEHITYVPVFAGDGTGRFAEPQLLETGHSNPRTLIPVPIAGVFEAGKFTVTAPPLNIPSGALNLTASTEFNTAVSIDPGAVIGQYTQQVTSIGVVTEPAHGTVTIQTLGTPGAPSDDQFLYRPDPGFTGTDTFTFVVADGFGGTSTGTVTVHVGAANLPPVVTLSNSTVYYFEIGSPLFVEQQAIVSDPETTHFQGGRLTISITDNFVEYNDSLDIEIQGFEAGQISLAYNVDLDLYYSGEIIGKVEYPNPSTITIDFTSSKATPAAVSAVLRALSYSSYDYERTTQETRELSISLRDVRSATTTVTKTIVLAEPGSNLPPILTVSPTNAVYSVGGQAIVIDNQLTVTDPDSENFNGGTLSVVVEDGYFNDLVGIRNVGTGANQVNLSGNNVRIGTTTIGTYSGGFVSSETLVVTFNSNATVARVQLLLREITFDQDHSNPYLDTREISFTISDGTGATSLPVSRFIEFTEGSVGPVVSLASSSLNYVAGSAPVLIDGSAGVSDSDSSAFNGGQLRIEFQSGQSAGDALSIRETGTSSGQVNLNGNQVRVGTTVIGTYSGGFTSNAALVISLNDNALPSLVQTLLRHIQFEVTGSNPLPGNRVIRVTVSDESLNSSQPVTRTIQVTQAVVGESPSISLPGTSVTYSKLAPPLVIDDSVLVSEPTSGTGRIGGGTLELSINDISTKKKRFDLLNVTSLNSIGSARTPVVVNGRMVLIYDIDPDTTAQELRNALRSVTFQTSKKGLKTPTRTILVQLTDSDGDASQIVSKTINVSKKKLKSRSR